MCGITGIINARRSPAELMEKVRRMCQSIHYRGPDGDGIYQDELTPSLVLGHRRLAIIDPEHANNL